MVSAVRGLHFAGSIAPDRRVGREIAYPQPVELRSTTLPDGHWYLDAVQSCERNNPPYIWLLITAVSVSVDPMLVSGQETLLEGPEDQGARRTRPRGAQGRGDADLLQARKQFGEWEGSVMDLDQPCGTSGPGKATAINDVGCNAWLGSK
jgi:hypothetical protein